MHAMQLMEWTEHDIRAPLGEASGYFSLQGFGEQPQRRKR